MIPAQHRKTQAFCRSAGRWCGIPGLVLMILLLAAGAGSAQDADLPEEEGPVDHTTEDVPLARYVDLQPEFVLNYGRDGRVRFLRLEINLVTGGAEGASVLNYHAPALRHIVVLNVTEAERETINSSEGRERLRREIRDEMRALLRHETGEPHVERVLFSNLIVQ